MNRCWLKLRTVSVGRRVNEKGHRCCTLAQPIQNMVQVLYGLHCSNYGQVSCLVNEFRLEGKESLMVVADFDYTLTLRHGDSGELGCLTHEVFDTSKEVKSTGCTFGVLASFIFHDFLQLFQ
ncbi:hypothetical protein GCK32_020762 [Trichostrongylus colubriformis]|uniref:5'-nucleotidase n=1 Tax=Trichostrongylus colubriformis TaxID=6319 RepID=A0AAN8IA32_TRICO